MCALRWLSLPFQRRPGLGRETSLVKSSRASQREVPLVGREAELEEITAAFVGFACAAVLIAGPAGVGKSRLAAEAADSVAAIDGAGRSVAHVIATEGTDAIPFGPFAALLPDIAAVASQPLELMESMSRAIAGLAQGAHPLLLVVDDSQFLDAASAALVHQLVASRACGLLATVRTPDVVTQPITSLWKDELAMRVEVQALSRREAHVLAASYLGGDVSGSAQRWVWDVTGGNPLFVRELLIGALETGAAYCQDGIWFLRQPIQAPSRLTDLIASRLSTVPPETQEVLELLAVSEPLGFEELVELGGAESVEDAESRGLIVARDDQRRLQARLRHPIYREILRQRMPRVRLRRLSGALAAAIEATGARRRDDIMRIARWRLDTGALGNPELFERAAREARAVRDLPLAARLARAALDAGGGVTAGLFLGETEFAAGHHDEAERIFADLTPRCATDDERALIANARSYNLGILMGDEPAAAAVIEAALATIEDPASRHRLLIRQVINDVWAGRLAATLATAAELMASSDELAVRRGSYACAVALALRGQSEEAVETAYRAMELHRRSLSENRQGALQDYQPPEGQLVGAVMGHLLGGRLAAAETDARRAYELSLELGDREFQATYCVLLGWVLVEQGRLGDAAKFFREGAAVNRELADLAPLRWCLGGLVLSEAMSGNTAAAREAESELSSIPPHWMVALDLHLVDRCRGWLLIASGQLTAARASLKEAADRARATEQYVAEGVLLHDIARLGDAKPVSPRLSELTELVIGDLVQALAEDAVARAVGSPPALEAAAKSFEAIGAVLLAAETAHAAAGAYHAAGRPRQASALSRECGRLLRLCGAERSPLVVTVEAAVSLTKRELEIAMLAVSGRSSKEIADRLVVSVRTVDNHLQRVYSKLGVSNRVALEGALREAGVEKRQQ